MNKFHTGIGITYALSILDFWSNCGQTLSCMNHTHFPLKLLITAYCNMHIHTYKVKREGTKKRTSQRLFKLILKALWYHFTQ